MSMYKWSQYKLCSVGLILARTLSARLIYTQLWNEYQKLIFDPTGWIVCQLMEIRKVTEMEKGGSSSPFAAAAVAVRPSPKSAASPFFFFRFPYFFFFYFEYCQSAFEQFLFVVFLGERGGGGGGRTGTGSEKGRAAGLNNKNPNAYLFSFSKQNLFIFLLD